MADGGVLVTDWQIGMIALQRVPAPTPPVEEKESRMYRKVTPDEINQMATMRREGMTVREISAQMCLETASVKYSLRRAGINPVMKPSRLAKKPRPHIEAKIYSYLSGLRHPVRISDALRAMGICRTSFQDAAACMPDLKRERIGNNWMVSL